MNDAFTSWKIFHDNILAMQKAQIEAATKLMRSGEQFNGALKAAQNIAEANSKAWESWMAMWGFRK